MTRTWLTFEESVTVTVGGETRSVTVVLDYYYGAENDPTPHRRAMRTADVFAYNGHSYMGSGPLDTRHYQPGDLRWSIMVREDAPRRTLSHSLFSSRAYLPLPSMVMVESFSSSWITFCSRVSLCLMMSMARASPFLVKSSSCLARS